MDSLTVSNTLPSLFDSVVNENPKNSPMAPKDLLDYRALGKYEQIRVSEKLFQLEHIKQYLDDKWEAERHNRDCFLWLWEVHQTENDDQKRHALEVKLTQFKRV